MDTRYGVRKPTAGTVTLCSEDGVRSGRIFNLSVPGCEVSTTLPLHKGQCVRLDIYLANQPPMRIDLGVVRWAADGEAGIEFIRMSEEDASRLRWYAGPVEKNGMRNGVEGRRAEA